MSSISNLLGEFFMLMGSRITRATVASVLVLLAIASHPALYGQENKPPVQRNRGIAAYHQGDFPKAIDNLKEAVRRNSGDADAWYFLGLAYGRGGDYQSARPAFETVLWLRSRESEANAALSFILVLANETKPAIAAAERAIALGNSTAEPHYAIAESNLRVNEYAKAIQEADVALRIQPDFAPALITKSLAHRGLRQFAEAAASLEKFLAINPKDRDRELWRPEVSTLRRWNDKTSASSSSDRALRSSQVTVRPTVLDKPEPSYTEAARRAGVNGTVILWAVFSRDGRVRSVSVMRALGFGLTTNAVQAARKIRFTPAQRDKVRVSMWMQLEYNFHLY